MLSKLRVAFNATALMAPPTGIGNYIVELGAALAATDEIDSHSFCNRRWRHEPPKQPSAETQTHARRLLRTTVKRFVPFARQLRHVQQQRAFALGLRKNRIAVYHEPNYVPICYDVPVVVTVHDLSWHRYPETHPADRIRWLERAMPTTFERAAAIVVDSDFIRRELRATFAVSDRRVHTVHLGVSPAFHPRSAAETHERLDPIGLAHGGYVLAVGTIEPRKNIGHVLAAYSLLPDALRAQFPLVIAGAKGWHATDLERKLRVLMEEGQVRFLGRVPQGVLPMLYAGAKAFVFASLYEGFGLPPLEAMASGVPTLVADRASLPEVTGDAALRIDPERPEDTARTLAGILEDADAHADLGHRGRLRATEFTWEKTARATLRVYRSVV